MRERFDEESQVTPAYEPRQLATSEVHMRGAGAGAGGTGSESKDGERGQTEGEAKRRQVGQGCMVAWLPGRTELADGTSPFGLGV